MDIRLAYGTEGKMIHLEDSWNVQVLEPKYIPGLPDSLAALQDALRDPIGVPPLAEMVTAQDRVGIIVNDITRATPTPLMLRALLDEIPHVSPENITIFIALGTHRQMTPAEVKAVIGEEFIGAYRVVQNNSFDRGTQVLVGLSEQGHEIWINKDLVACSIKILTGFIEPHFFAGFSGGGKALLPGMAGLESIMANHRPENILDPHATWGQTNGNPIWEDVRNSARKAGASFILNVTLNRDKQITAVFAGDLEQAHARGVEFVRSTAMVPVDQPFDIVITTNSGYPLDQNLYQTVKGMSAAAQVVRQGGSIMLAAECRDGIPDHGLYGQLLRNSSSPQQLLDTLLQPGYRVQDQWQAQIQAQIQLKADIYVHSGCLSADQVRQALLNPSESIEATLASLIDRYGKSARICILPEGPQTIPYIR
jgi:lactate racemase